MPTQLIEGAEELLRERALEPLPGVGRVRAGREHFILWFHDAGESHVDGYGASRGIAGTWVVPR